MAKTQNINEILEYAVHQLVPTAPKIEELKTNKRLMLDLALANGKVLEKVLPTTNYKSVSELKKKIRDMRNRLDCEPIFPDEKADLKYGILM